MAALAPSIEDDVRIMAAIVIGPAAIFAIVLWAMPDPR
jgi:hypothetical protein